VGKRKVCNFPLQTYSDSESFEKKKRKRSTSRDMQENKKGKLFLTQVTKKKLIILRAK
jgi:hypothetical protein